MNYHTIFGLLIFVVLGSIGLIAWIINEIAEHKFRKEMIKKCYKWKFIISCSADPDSWQWVKRLI